MALQPSPEAKPSLFDDAPDKANENEIATYRAISPMAILSAIFGVASILCFIAPVWLFLPVLAIVAGLLAFRKIRKFPEMATGRSYAQAGISLGLICGLASVTYSQVVMFQVTREMSAYGQTFAQALNSRDAKKASIFLIPPEYLKDVPSEEVDKKVQTMMQGATKLSDSRNNLTTIIAALKKPDDRVELLGMTKVGFDELAARGIATFKVGSENQKALAQFRSGVNASGRRMYCVDAIVFPAKN